MVNRRRSVRTVPQHVTLRTVLVLMMGLLLLGAWAALAGVQLVQAGRHASRQAALVADGVAGSIDAALARFAEQVQVVRPGDFAGADRVSQTARLLRFQILLPATATFMIGADGQLLAASAPFTRQDAAVADAPWFRRALAAPPDLLAAQRLDRPWFGTEDGIVLARTVVDATGKPVGLIGALLPQGRLQGLVSPDWLSTGTSISLGNGGENGPLLVGADPALNPGATMGQSLAVKLDVLRRLDEPTHWSAQAPLHRLDGTVTASLSPDAVLANRPFDTLVLVAGGLLLAAWLVAIGLAIPRRRPGRPVAAVVGFGNDWQLVLDATGIVRETRGLVPDALAGATGQPLLAALGLAADAPEARQIDEALRRQVAVTDLTVRLGTGETAPVCRISLAADTPDGFLCSGRDITAEVAATAAQELATAKTAEARHDQERLLTSLGHDMRTPMTSIMGICELLLDGELEQEQRTWLERVHGSCGALLGMLNGLLEVAGGEVGRGALLREPVDVTALVQEVVDVLRPQARDKGLELRASCDDLLRGQWLLDPIRLRQVVFNLASNAVKFTASGRVEIRASAVPSDGRSRLRIAVSDTGPGIDPGEREQIFERFKRGRAQEGSGQGGLGLGLALCRENATLMSGAITLQSALGVGSEFTFECPADPVAAQDRPMPFAGRTALIVADDDPATRALASQLSETGLLVETAPDGYLGLALAERLEAQRGAVDLVVLQGNLPGMPGEVFILRLRATPFGRRAVVVWVGKGAETAQVDASVPARDPYQIAAIAKQLLAERPSFDLLEPNVSLFRGGRVLLAEDDKANQALLAAAMSRRGFAVFIANDGEEAVRLASRDSFDAIVMDLQMPGLDGFAATQRIRALPNRGATVPIIALTALQGARLRQRCSDAGFTSVLEKPVNLDRLTATLHRWIGQGRSETVAEAPEPGTIDYVADVSAAFLEEMVAVVGLDRARACVAEFITDATARCTRLSELLPGWEVDAILRSCEEISGMAETCGALALGELLEEIADAATRSDAESAERLIGRLDTVVARLPIAMAACLDDVARRWSRDSKAA